MLDILLITLFPLAMFFAATSDLLTMTISNKVTLVLIGGFIALSPAIGMDAQTIAWHGALAAIVLGIGFGFFAAGWMGGGDVKLAAATSLWLGWEHVLPYLAFSAILGGLASLLLITARARVLPLSMTNVSWIARLHDKDEGVPYGIALGPAAVFIYLDTPWMEYVFQSGGG